jgi:2,4-dienoyl-CoA reductase-like NADH-dependent reductase (Old Yellow Enzyme family)
LETAKLIRQTIPTDMPLFVRISGSDHLDTNPDKDLAARAWTIEQSSDFAVLLADAGVDVIDVSSGGNHMQQKVAHGPAYQAYLAFAVKEKVGDRAFVSSVGGILEASVAEDLLQKGLDLVALGRAFMKNPGTVLTWADDMGVTVKMPNQIDWAFPALPPGMRK